MDELKRNDKGFILSNIDMSKNDGLLEVFISDNRYRTDDFRYIVDSNFKSLPPAVKAQNNVIVSLNKKIQDYIDSRFDTTPVTDTELKKQELSFFNSMTNIKYSDTNSVDRLKNEILVLKDQIKTKNELLKSKEEIDIVNENNINTLSKDLIRKDLELKAKDQVIQNLTEQLNIKLQELENLVSQQLNTSPSSLNDITGEL